MDNLFYKLPYLDYKYSELEPFVSEEQLKVHRRKHHLNYVKKANELILQLEKARKDNQAERDIGCLLERLAFNLGGHILHSAFWSNLAPPGKGGGGEPKGTIKKIINEEFGGSERFKFEFERTVLSIEGSGWAVLVFDCESNRLLCFPMEKHNVNIYPEVSILLALDIWEHAYYIDYRNDKGKFIQGFWNLVNWRILEERLQFFSRGKVRK